MPPEDSLKGIAACRIGIMGTPASSSNQGVIALAESLVRLSCEAIPGAQAMLLGSARSSEPIRMHPEGEPVLVPMVNWRLSPKSRLSENLLVIVAMSAAYRCVPLRRVRAWLSARSPWIRAVESCAFVGDVRGGDSFSDIYGFRRFLIASMPVWSVLAIKGGMIQFPQTYGPYKGRLARWMARRILLRSSCVVARDRHSQRVAEDLLRGQKPVLLSPDVAFALHVRPPARIQTDLSADHRVAPGTLGMNINGLMFHGGYNRGNQFGLKLNYADYVRQLVRALLASHPGELLLVPHTYGPPGDVESDNEVSQIVKGELPEDLRARVHVVTGDYDPHELKSIIGRCDAFVGSRMHACIGALSQGLPCVGVAYSMKFLGVFESVGMGDWVVDARAHDTAEAVTRTLELLRGREAARSGLRARALKAREDLKQVFASLLNTGPKTTKTLVE